MKPKITTYLRSIGMKKPLIERIGLVCDRFTQLTSLDIEDLFVSEYVLEDGTRAYDDIRIFAPGMIVEADQFQSHDSFFINPVEGLQRMAWEISAKKFDFKSATADSRLTARLSTGDYSVPFKASKENCEVLTTIIQKYLPAHQSLSNQQDNPPSS